MSEFKYIAELIPFLGVPGTFLLIFIFALHKRWIRLGREYDAVKSDRDWWKQLAMENIARTSAAVEMTHRAIGAIEKTTAAVSSREAS